MDSDKSCSEERCPNKAHARGLCTKHYQRLKKAGPLAPIDRNAPCVVDGCGRKRVGRGLCDRHHRIHMKGTPITDLPPIADRNPRAIRDGQGRKLCPSCSEFRDPSSFSGNSRAVDGLQDRCKSCCSEYARGHQIRKYGITVDAYNRMIADQRGLCLICAEEPSKFHIDHDHACCPGEGSCGKCVRGLLCSRCNQALGMMYDNPARLRAAAEYLERGAA